MAAARRRIREAMRRALPLALLTGVVSQPKAQAQPSTVPEYSCPDCPLHIPSGPGPCSECGQPLLGKLPSGQRELDAEDLRGFCEEYVEWAVERKRGDVEALLVRAYAAMRGDAAPPALRKLLDPRRPSALAAAATELGRLGDRSSASKLRRLLEHDLEVEVRYRCTTHEDAQPTTDGRCPACSSWMKMRWSGLDQALAVAGALHAMRVPEGRKALLEHAREPYRFLVFGALLPGGDPELTGIVERAASDGTQPYQAWALAAQLEVGVTDNLPAGLALLGDDRWRPHMLRALRAGTVVEALPALQELARGDAMQGREELWLAQALVRLGHENHLSALHRATRSDSLQDFACDGLGDAGTAESLPFLLDAIRRGAARTHAIAAVVQICHRDH